MISCKERGITMMEVIVALTLGVFVIAGMFKLSSRFMEGFQVQDQKNEMHQNAIFTIRHISEVIMEAGADLPSRGLPVIQQLGDTIALYVNPKAALHVFSQTLSGSFIPVNDGAPFNACDSIVRLYNDSLCQWLTIDRTYSSYGYTRGIKTSSLPDTIKINEFVNFAIDDQLFSATRARYFRDGTNLCRNLPTAVMAEGIDSLAIAFYDSTSTVATSWNCMRYATIRVTAMTGVADNMNKTTADRRHRLTMSNTVYLRNR